MNNKDFSLRLAKLRTLKGVSARDMSLSLGQNPSYINHIESGKALPSMTAFFYICEYLGITPLEFFDTASQNPSKMDSLICDMKKLNEEQLDTISTLVRNLADK